MDQLIRSHGIGLEDQSEIELLLDKEATRIYVVKVNTTAGLFCKKKYFLE
ncbi:hypothetical protein QO200_07135 [Flavobacterium sp. Arc3]